MTLPLPHIPEAIARIYPFARVTGIWPWVRAVRLRMLAAQARQLHLTDLRQSELVRERYTLERLP